MAENKDKEKTLEVKETGDKGSEEQTTGRSEAEELAYLIRCSQYAESIYH